MGKIFNYTLIFSGVLILLAFAGFPTASNGLLNIMGFTLNTNVINGPPISFSLGVLTASFAALIVAMFAASRGQGGSVSIGSYVASALESKLVAGVVTFYMTYMIGDLISILNIASDFSGAGLGWLTSITYLIVVPMIIAFVFALVQFWRGSDI